jgi:hypothetical protein
MAGNRSFLFTHTAFKSHGVGPWIADEEHDIPVTVAEGLVFSTDLAWKEECEEKEISDATPMMLDVARGNCHPDLYRSSSLAGCA